MTKLISLIFYAFARTLHATYRYRYDGNEHIQALKGRNYIYAIWHQNLLAGILAQNGKQHVVIVSKSKDAEPAAFAATTMGHIATRGSSRKGDKDKGGKAAKDEMITVLQRGIPGAITVDGPKGPAFEVKPGIIDMAIKSNSVIVPYVLTFSSYWEFKSWDRFRLPKPFSRILISYGPGVDVADQTVDQRLIIQHAINSTTAMAKEKIDSWHTYSAHNWWHKG